MDKVRPKQPLASIIPLDLTKDEDKELVFGWIKQPSVRGVFLAPPCGTASAARNIELEDVPNAPKPLRSFEHPDGIPGISGDNLQRVSFANILYEFTANVMDLCTSLNKPCMVENPRNSLFWFTSMWSECHSSQQHYIQDHQACMYGAKRAKWTRLVANFEEVHTICKVCDNSHKHEAWGVIHNGRKRIYATSLEVHYPQGLCVAICHAFTLHLSKQGLKFDFNVSLQHTAQAATLQQTAKHSFLPMIPAYKVKLVVIFRDNNPIMPSDFAVTEQFKLLHEFSVGQGDVDERIFCLKDELKLFQIDCPFSEESLKKMVCHDVVKVFGVQWTPLEFLERAHDSAHPAGNEQSIPVELQTAVEANAAKDPTAVVKSRLEFFKKWTSRCKELESDEKKLRQSMDPVVDAATKGKRIALFSEMLEFYNYPDLGVIQELKEGVDLVGEVPTTGMLPFKFVPPLLTPQALAQQSEMRRQRIMKQSCSSGDPTVDAEVWRQTLEECDKSWMKGPLNAAEVPDCAPISKRFGLQQKAKTRLIDDYSESSVNDAVTVLESPVLHTVDVACAILAFWFSACKAAGSCSKLDGRTFDLASAYRQVALSKAGREVSFVRVHDPVSNKPALFQALVLPFGAVRSVHSFLRLARAVWWLGVIGCNLVWSSFYDDFIVFSSPSLSRSAELSVVSLFKLLGWLFAEEGKKCVPFSDKCEALGVLFNLEQTSGGVARVCNTKARVDEVAGEIERLLKQGKINKLDAQKLRGRMQFSEAQIFGRTGKRCISTLKEFANSNKLIIDERDEFYLRLFVKFLRDGEPREIKSDDRAHCFALTDACYERDAKEWQCGIGAFFCDVLTGEKFFFSIELTEEQRILLGENHKEQIIFEAETLSAILAFDLWSERCATRKFFLYVDNEGTKFSLIKGCSPNAVVDLLAQHFAECESVRHCLCWLSRVASYSNLADMPSRGDCKLVSKLGGIDVSCEAVVSLAKILAAIKLKLGHETAAENPT